MRVAVVAACAVGRARATREDAVGTKDFALERVGDARATRADPRIARLDPSATPTRARRAGAAIACAILASDIDLDGDGAAADAVASTLLALLDPSVPSEAEADDAAAAADAAEAASEAAAAETTTKKAPGPLQRGGTLDGDKAAGKDAGSAAKTGALFANGTQEWSDPRWKNGTWDLTQFKLASGETDWDAVIDAEVVHRKALEDCPAVYDEDGLFDTSIVPWWVWVKRFHLPEAEKINGRAAMVGYAFAYVIDAAGGAGLVDLHQSFLGKTAIFLTVAFCLTVRRLEDMETLSVLADEATFYDKQWAASWEGKDRDQFKDQ